MIVTVQPVVNSSTSLVRVLFIRVLLIPVFLIPVFLIPVFLIRVLQFTWVGW